MNFILDKEFEYTNMARNFILNTNAQDEVYSTMIKLNISEYFIPSKVVTVPFGRKYKNERFMIQDIAPGVPLKQLLKNYLQIIKLSNNHYIQ